MVLSQFPKDQYALQYMYFINNWPNSTPSQLISTLDNWKEPNSAVTTCLQNILWSLDLLFINKIYRVNYFTLEGIFLLVSRLASIEIMNNISGERIVFSKYLFRMERVGCNKKQFELSHWQLLSITIFLLFDAESEVYVLISGWKTAVYACYNLDEAGKFIIGVKPVYWSAM